MFICYYCLPQCPQIQLDKQRVRGKITEIQKKRHTQKVLSVSSRLQHSSAWPLARNETERKLLLLKLIKAISDSFAFNWPENINTQHEKLPLELEPSKFTKSHERQINKQIIQLCYMHTKKTTTLEVKFSTFRLSHNQEMNFLAK